MIFCVHYPFQQARRFFFVVSFVVMFGPSVSLGLCFVWKCNCEFSKCLTHVIISSSGPDHLEKTSNLINGFNNIIETDLVQYFQNVSDEGSFTQKSLSQI